MDGAGLAQLTEDLAPLTRRFDDAGHRLYLVGGVVRDLELGRRSAGDDVDLTTDAPPDVVRQLVAPVAVALWTQGERFGTIGAHVGGHAVEITTHRAELYQEGSRKPVVAFGPDLERDLSRRDFTINAMARRLPAGELVDPFGGVRDLRAGRLRTPLDPQLSFSDDPLRMLRAARFAARFDLTADPSVVEAMTAMGDRLAIVSRERVHDELERLLDLPRPGAGLALLVDTGLLARVLAEVVAAGAVADPRFGGRSRLEVAVEAAASSAPPLARRALLWLPAALSEGPPAVARIGRELRYSTDDRRRTEQVVEAVVATLERSRAAPTGGAPADLAASVVVRRLAAALGADLSALWPALDGLRAQATDPELVVHLEAVLAAGRRMAAEGELQRLDPPLDGRAIMAHLGCGPGPVVGDALAALRHHIAETGPLDQEQARALLDRWWAERGRR